MKALKVATDKQQKADLSAQCQVLLGEAERIKKSPEWPATSALPSISSLSLNPEPPRPATFPLQKPKVDMPAPVSDRVLTTSEQIILLKSSKINGATFPPWKTEPADTDFIGNIHTLDNDDNILRLSESQREHFWKWRRADDATMTAATSVDLVQDAATDCSVVSSLVVARARAERLNEKKPLSATIFPYDHGKGVPKVSENGKYVFRLNFNGCWRKVEVDSRLPASLSSRMLHVFDRNNPSLLWPALLEKAYLKVRGGYDFPGSSSCTDLWTIFGWIPEQIHLPEADMMPDELWSRLFKSFGFGDILMTVGTGNMSRRTERELGLVSQHNYAVLDLKEENGARKLLLKNPWAQGEPWTGPGRPSPPLLPSHEHDKPLAASQPRPDKMAPGTFWVNLEHVFQNFDNIYVNWNPALFRYRQDIHFEWDLASLRLVPGCLVDNPQFSLKVEGSEPIWLLLSRHFKNHDSDIPSSGVYSDDDRSKSSVPVDLAPGYISLYIFDEGGNRVYTSLEAMESDAFVSSPQMLLKWKNPAKSTYTVVVEQMELPSSTYSFTLSAFSRQRVCLNFANKKFGHSAKLKSAWNKDTGGGNLQSPTFSKNPQFKLTVPQATSLAILLQVPDGSIKSNVVVLHGKGKRMHAVRTRDIVVSSGLYKKHCAFAEVKNVDPGIYTLACSTFEAGQRAEFELRVDSDTPCKLAPIPQEGAGRLLTQLAKACFSPASNRIAAPIVPRKLVRVEIVAKFARAYGSHEAESQMGSPLRVTIEIGRGPDRRILIASADGDYSDAEVGVRTTEVDLRPDMLLQGDMWLVLDRLSGPSTGGPECYSVDLFCDSMDGLSVGVWRGWDA
ncbi:hypothetical protein B0J12DRAFT_569576 [Macrophomina phaseolina]|uniref:Calpain catalytic domain-containing protein n=1 Tax=Macrophomina phaseolina TaxID=35725 RepID=A0ABQ8GH72_9PEZI|nr:hypothetical protein B0J12DRAFT_569576 [Macrophomina phaseolina]